MKENMGKVNTMDNSLDKYEERSAKKAKNC